LVNHPGEGEHVVGELYEVDEVALTKMDKLERIPTEDGYHRLTIEVCGDGETLTAFTYLKQAGQLENGSIKQGPLAEYKLEHSELYRPRGN
jgi:gamma-glutamylaminecyclotransferase